MTVADGSASAKDDIDETMADAPAPDPLTTNESQAGEGAVETSPPSNLLGGDAMAGGTATAAGTAAGNAHSAPSTAATSAMACPAAQGAVEQSQPCNLPVSNTVAGGTASIAYRAAAARPVLPLRTAVKLGAKIVCLQSRLTKERTKTNIAAKNAIRSSEDAKDLLEELKKVEKYAAGLRKQHQAEEGELEQELAYVNNRAERLETQLNEAKESVAVAKQSAEESQKKVKLLERRLARMGKEMAAMKDNKKQYLPWGRMANTLGVAVGSIVVTGFVTAGMVLHAVQKA